MSGGEGENNSLEGEGGFGDRCGGGRDKGCCDPGIGSGAYERSVEWWRMLEDRAMEEEEE